jgi:hypothetical protein
MFVPPNWLTLPKNKKHPWGRVDATQLVLLTCFILMCFIKDKLLGHMFPFVEFFFNKLNKG